MVEKTIGDTIGVQVNIKNVGNVTHEFWVYVELTGIGVSRGMVASVPLDVEDIGTATFPFIAEAPAGTYDVGVYIFQEEELQTKLAERVLPGEVIIREMPVYSAQIVSVTVS